MASLYSSILQALSEIAMENSVDNLEKMVFVSASFLQFSEVVASFVAENIVQHSLCTGWPFVATLR